jgi:cytochrome c556
MIRIAIATSVLLLAAGLVAAQQDVVATREGLMKLNGKNMYTMLNQMARETKPYDQAAVDAALNQFEDTASKLPALYPDSSKVKKLDSEYSPSAKIWENKADFESHIAGLAKAVKDLKGKIISLETLKTAYPVINGQCNDCHETYRVKD